jgi:hypothetical protein
MQVNRRSIIPVVKVTITTFFPTHKVEAFSKIGLMTEEQQCTGRIYLLSVEGQPTKAVLVQTCMGVFFIRSVSDTIIAMLFLPRPPQTTV